MRDVPVYVRIVFEWPRLGKNPRGGDFETGVNLVPEPDSASRLNRSLLE